MNKLYGFVAILFAVSLLAVNFSTVGAQTEVPPASEEKGASTPVPPPPVTLETFLKFLKPGIDYDAVGGGILNRPGVIGHQYIKLRMGADGKLTGAFQEPTMHQNSCGGGPFTTKMVGEALVFETVPGKTIFGCDRHLTIKFENGELVGRMQIGKVIDGVFTQTSVVRVKIVERK